jgi:hypothetical protein
VTLIIFTRNVSPFDVKFAYTLVFEVSTEDPECPAFVTVSYHV